MFVRLCTLRALLPAGNVMMNIGQTAGLKNFPPPPKYEEIEFPDRNRLRVVERVPQYPPTLRPFKMQKRLRYMRGPEELHTTFIHRQFGIIALGGGRLKFGHFEMVRNTLTRAVDTTKVFGVWRVDPPWQPVTKKGQGQRMGGGKAAIDHYVTPIKANRVIVEVGGHCEWFDVERVLKDIAAKLPFKAMALTNSELEEIRRKEAKLENDNVNPWTWKYIIQNNLGGCHNWISPKDKVWFGKYR